MRLKLACSTCVRHNASTRQRKDARGKSAQKRAGGGKSGQIAIERAGTLPLPFNHIYSTFSSSSDISFSDRDIFRYIRLLNSGDIFLE